MIEKVLSSRCAQLRLNDEQRRSFEYFRRFSVPEIMFAAPVLDWMRAILLTCLDEPLIFHAVALVGTAKRAGETAWHTTLAQPVDPAINVALLQGYGRILVDLQHRLRGATTDLDIEYVLLTCMLLFMAELYRGNMALGVRHMFFGKSILKERYADILGLRDGGDRTMMDTSDTTRMLIRTFFPYGIEAARTLEKPSAGLKIASPGSHFASLAQATQYLNSLVESSNELRNDLLDLAEVFRRGSIPDSRDSSNATRFCIAQCCSRFVDLSGRPRVSHRLQELRDGHSAWRAAFQKLVASPHLAPQERVLLQIRYFTSSFTLSTCRDTEEAVIDGHMDDFRSILELCERYLKRRRLFRPGPIERRVAEKPDIAHHLDYGILPALLLICCKCRESEIRHRALHVLLQARRMEAFVSSDSLAAFAGSIIALEERAARTALRMVDNESTIISSSDRPGGMAFSDVVFDGKPLDGTHRVICTRLRSGDSNAGPSIEVSEYMCSQPKANQVPAGSNPSFTVDRLEQGSDRCKRRLVSRRLVRLPVTGDSDPLTKALG